MDEIDKSTKIPNRQSNTIGQDLPAGKRMFGTLANTFCRS
jgi:hypothetical protein